MDEERLNEEAARNNNLDSATIRTSVDFSEELPSYGKSKEKKGEENHKRKS